MNNRRYKEPEDMHKLIIWSPRGADQRIENYSASSQDGNVRVLFHNLEEHLIEYIRQSDVVLGCVAWLTSEPILLALADVKGVSIIVQKEDFLRPDMVSTGKQIWAKRLRTLYGQLPKTLYRFSFDDTILSHLSVAGDTSMDPVRCVGNHNDKNQAAFPRSHHKFVIFCDYVQGDEVNYGIDMILPKCVWTGSYNFTKTAGKSFENAVVLQVVPV